MAEPRLDIDRLLTQLAQRRPVFHSERDFQFALAWLIQEEHRGAAEIRLESHPWSTPGKSDPRSLDVQVNWSDETYTAIELKYKTEAWNGTLRLPDAEYFDLKGHGADDEGSYDFIKDIARLEELSDLPGGVWDGWAIFLTNDPKYRNPTIGPANHAAFRLGNRSLRAHEVMAWAGGHNLTPTKRSEPIELRSDYSLEWRNFMPQGDTGGPSFDVLAVHVMRRLSDE